MLAKTPMPGARKDMQLAPKSYIRFMHYTLSAIDSGIIE
jgi:hypothetical protein